MRPCDIASTADRGIPYSRHWYYPTPAAYSTLLESAAAGSVYNVCTGYAHSIAELAQRASSLFGLTLEFQVEDALVRKGERRRPVVPGFAERPRGRCAAPYRPRHDRPSEPRQP